MTVFWCESAILDAHAAAAVRIEERGGLITAVEVGVRPRDTDVILVGLVLPGLANAHSHAFHRALRGRTHAGGGDFWSWRERMYGLANMLDPDSYFELATAVFAEMVLAGYTVVGEFHYLHRRANGESYEPGTAMEDAVVAAAARAGIRLTLLDALYLRGGLSATGDAMPLDRTQARFSDGSVEAWTTRREAVSFGPLARPGIAIHSARAVPEERFRAVAEAAGGLPLHAHVSEQPAENAAVLARTGRTPTELFAEAGLLGPNFTAVHATHLSPNDIHLLGGTSSSVCFCPTTERDLADGIGPGVDVLAAGAHLSLGSDQNAVIDPFEELRGLEMNARLASGERGRFTPAELLDAATSAGYRSLGWDGGALRVGALADLVAVSLTSPRTAGAFADQAWLAATAADVHTVIVGGVARVSGSTHELGQIGELIAAAVGRLG
jgi:formiminoglutamate deiminase